MSGYQPPGVYASIPTRRASLPLMEAIRDVLMSAQGEHLSDKARLGYEIAHEIADVINSRLGHIVEPREIYILLNYDKVSVILPPEVQWRIAQHEEPMTERLRP